MKPTFLRVGKPKAITRAPSTVRPPTESSAATLGGFTSGTWTDESTQSLTLPSSMRVGDLCLVHITIEIGGVASGNVPAGWTEIYNYEDVAHPYNYASLWAKTVASADIGGTFDLTGLSADSDGAWVAYFVKANGGTLAPADITLGGPVSGPTIDYDTPAVTPSQGAGDYLVFVAWHQNKGAFTTSWADSGPTGYSTLVEADEGGGVLSPGIHTWYRQVSIVTAEDPSAIAWTDSAGSRAYALATLSVPITSGDPQVVGYPVTASDIDSESATDGQVLTADGAGGAAWEDAAAGVTDHGALTGLTDDDHSQYLNVARHDADDHSSLSIGADDLTSTYELLVASTDSTIDRFVATADKTIANTTTETTLFGTGEGNLTFPAGFFTAGKAIRVLMRGRLSDTGTPNFTIKMKLGSTVIDSVGPVALTGISDVEWMLDGLITCRSTGASGTFVGGGLFDYDDGSELSLGSGSDVSVDTTASQTFDITWQWGTASASNTITVREAAVTLIDPNRDGIGGLEPVFTEAGDDYVYGLVP